MAGYKDDYGAEIGIRVTCQHCGKQIFRRKINIEEFEPMPKRWRIIHDYYHYGWWCPECTTEYTI